MILVSVLTVMIVIIMIFFFLITEFLSELPPGSRPARFWSSWTREFTGNMQKLEKKSLGSRRFSRQSEISHLSVQGFGWIWSRMNKKSAEQNSIKEFRYIGHEYIKWMQCCIAAENSTRNVFGGTWWRSPATDARIMSKVPMAFELRMQKMSLHPSILQRCLPESKNVILILAGPSIANIMQA